MINKIKELQEYVLRDLDEKDDVIFQRPCMMTSPGCAKSKVEELKKTLPGIPESYTKWVEAVNLNGISVGWFGISPFSFNPEGMIANLIEGNEEGVLFSEYARFYHLYSVATIDGYGIFVATASSPYKEGEIITIDESIYVDKENPEKWIYKLAKDFKQFLIVAGNVNQVNREIKDDGSTNDKRRKELFDRLNKLGVDEEYHKIWLDFF